MKNETPTLRERLGNEEIPVGELSLPTDELFVERQFYKDNIFPKSEIPSQNFWYLKPYYGLVNRQGFPVYPSESNLKQLKSNKTLLALNFVVDAFEDFKDLTVRAMSLGKIDTVASTYANIEPVRAWESVHQAYGILMETHYDQFYTQWLPKKYRDLKINCFDSFVDHFMEYLSKVVKQYPFTRSTFVTSTLCNPYISGLIIDIKNQDQNDDQPKKERFIDDPNFEFFRITANKFGFMVDENAPWRLIADLGSSAMKRYMSNYNITFDDVFDVCFYRADLTDLMVFKEYIKLFYLTYVDNQPEVRYLNAKQEQVVKQRKVTDQTYIDNLDNSYWFKRLIDLKLLEISDTCKIPVDGSQQTCYNHIYNNIIQIDKKLGSIEALNYLSSKLIKGYKLISYPDFRMKRFN